MLVLTRKKSQKIVVGENVTITILNISGGRVKIAIEAPKEVRVVRGELKNVGVKNGNSNIQRTD